MMHAQEVMEFWILMENLNQISISKICPKQKNRWKKSTKQTKKKIESIVEQVNNPNLDCDKLIGILNKY